MKRKKLYLIRGTMNVGKASDRILTLSEGMK